jgi:hypothetical protein
MARDPRFFLVARQIMSYHIANLSNEGGADGRRIVAISAGLSP